MLCKECGKEILADETNNDIGLCIFCEVKSTQEDEAMDDLKKER